MIVQALVPVVEVTVPSARVSKPLMVNVCPAVKKMILFGVVEVKLLKVVAPVIVEGDSALLKTTVLVSALKVPLLVKLLPIV